MGETQSSQSLALPVYDGGIICSLCYENLTRKDEVFVISCGHLFHSQCIQVWKLTYDNCPKCRKNTPKHMKVLPIFGENKNEGTIMKAYKQEIQRFEMTFKKLNEQLNESEQNCNQLKDKNDVLENEIHELKNQLSESTNRENQLKNEQPGERENNCKQLNGKDDVLENEMHELNDHLLDSINGESTERSVELRHTDSNAEQLRQQIDSLSELQRVMAEKYKTLNDKLNCVARELKKQLLKCSKLSLENRRLQNLIQSDIKFFQDTGTPIKAMSTINEYGEENVNKNLFTFVKQAGKQNIEKIHYNSSLYMYAKQKLKPHNYWIFFDEQNDQIMAVKGQNSTPTMLRNKEEVDKFIEQSSEIENNSILNICFEN
uniref:RING-type domain-containing protein n=1 Tax=Glossina austeni TaxID=7395 RepID=A0A1A9URG8_GLOAU